jgi:hypothetical protein
MVTRLYHRVNPLDDVLIHLLGRGERALAVVDYISMTEVRVAEEPKLNHSLPPFSCCGLGAYSLLPREYTKNLCEAIQLFLLTSTAICGRMSYSS